MRASPAFHISLHRFDVWRLGVRMFAALGLCAIVGWLITRQPPIGTAALILSGLAGVAIVWLAGSLARVPAISLRWDQLMWHIGRAEAPAEQSVAGDMCVAIDLGPWMLLRFKPAGSQRRAQLTWLPVQRLGIEADWHALRCAIYSPRPPPDADADATTGP